MDALLSSPVGMAGPGRVEVPPSVAFADLPNKANADIEQAAKQFESLFVNMMLKSMRAATASLTEDNYLSSRHVEMHQEMLDQQYASELASAGGIGLAEVIVRQMSSSPPSPSMEVNPLPPSPHSRAGFGRPDAAPETRSSSLEGEQASGVTSAPAPAQATGAEKERAPLFGSAQAFVDKVGQAVREAVADVPLPPVAILAQAALETGWGKHVPGNEEGSSHNLFGIKADSRWSGPTVELNTQEFVSGRMVTISDAFRAYESIAEGVRDYVRFITESERYTEAVSVSQEPKRYADALAKAGYATDPAYADKLKALIDQLEQQHDGIAF